MNKFNQLVTITPKTHPHVCGVGDYTVNLAKYCKTYHNIDIDLLVEKGCQATSEPVNILPYIEDWSLESCQKTINRLEAENVRTVILQYAPGLYLKKGYDRNFIIFWQECAKRFKTLLIAHETYYWFIKYPGTWVNGIIQQYVLRSIVNTSHHIFCGSELYLKHIKRFSNSHDKIHYLPIPNNIPPQYFSDEQKQALRHHLGIPPQQIVLILFGCLASIRQNWVENLDVYLRKLGYSITWLLLGEAKSVKIHFCNPVIRPGYLSAQGLSYHLQISDLLLMPHEFGVSAKRTSLMSALEHGLPVVGTDARLTDSFLRQLSSIFLSPDGNYQAFQEQLLNVLQQRSNLKGAIQVTQEYYQSNLSWNAVTTTLLPYL
ncbi:glycosyltransferase family 4 protein [Aphanizomenon flos-aquae FACHB-1416]|jgi:glycosyltransferase involved in cell wall biosynthesis|uniref:glycosyltransferase family 4 protein n=1 Tax=Aphanizomenon flos-aquae TaxID=1176 RepID=UPI0016813797|nr:glycosyltransferase family 4 protein [Aphanizomenon flos-aquae]MBD2391660.1 glycosyltransferase family 4 protein [Aphanizomenon flos-aquae FACHB-1171]MBD2556087.1 glycosyltransferase family 4 protein [Aphanizomenon flos-aquae FACHB-1290]MBD2658136.1 glycosyltransferase family 4 protein [Aphanizomenon flos-aquae FACHB-1265]MBD2675193.1 glycosyltransferase family 4 protein [Aphanizomenon flos-aquae FACHB-1416]MBD2698103.1 glycosyltransferase family 4 protein [Aphanizomenon flos-aquae FACHB-12